jgi:hypothetical protein
MRHEHLMSAVAAMFFVAVPVVAQQAPGDIGVVDFQETEERDAAAV